MALSKIQSLMAVPASAFLLIYTSLAEPQIQIKNYPIQNEIKEEDSSTHAFISYSAIEMIDKIQTLKNVASQLVDNAIELDPKIVEMVDRNFWELI